MVFARKSSTEETWPSFSSIPSLPSGCWKRKTRLWQKTIPATSGVSALAEMIPELSINRFGARIFSGRCLCEFARRSNKLRARGLANVLAGLCRPAIFLYKLYKKTPRQYWGFFGGLHTICFEHFLKWIDELMRYYN